jgi:hypothetical protein
MPLKLRATHLAPPAYAHLKEYAVLSGNWQIGSISEERDGKGWFWALGVGVPFDPDKVRMDGSAQSEPARSEAGCIQIKARRKATGAFSRAGP